MIIDILPLLLSELAHTHGTTFLKKRTEIKSSTTHTPASQLRRWALHQKLPSMSKTSYIWSRRLHIARCNSASVLITHILSELAPRETVAPSPLSRGAIGGRARHFSE